jgi:4'-phosphopantetheinyl transferase
MKVLWFEQSLADVRVEDDWFSAWETSHLSSLRFPKRRADWRLGRWTAKHAVADYLHLAHDPGILATIQIRPASTGAPEAFIDEASGNVSISLSHRGGIAACAVGEPDAMLGCDVEVVEPRSDAFVADYFTSEEQAMIRQAPDPVRFALIALIWSAKESALKALRTGLRSDTRCVLVTLDDSCIAGLNHNQLPDHENFLAVPRAGLIWRPLRVSYTEEQVFHGWWFCNGGLLRTMVSDPATEELTIPEPPAAGLPLPGTADHDHAAGTRALTTGTIHTA